MSSSDDLTGACQILVSRLHDLEEERDHMLTLNVPAQVLLTWIPLIKYAGNDILNKVDRGEVHAEDGPALEDSVEMVYASITHVLSLLTQAITENDPFKLFDLHAEMGESGIPIGITFQDEDGTIEEFPPNV